MIDIDSPLGRALVMAHHRMVAATGSEPSPMAGGFALVAAGSARERERMLIADLIEPEAAEDFLDMLAGNVMGAMTASLVSADPTAPMLGLLLQVYVAGRKHEQILAAGGEVK